MRALDLTGQRFGRLTALGRAESINGRTYWFCKCDCGNYMTASTECLVRGMTKNCGCLRWLHQRGKPDNLTGMRFGRLVAVEMVEKDYMNLRTTNMLWRCRCDCGRETIVLSNNLKAGKTRSCGCLRVKDLTGQRFGKLVVLGRAESDKEGTRWLCKCDCGNTTTVITGSLNSGNTKSCGCMKGRQLEDLSGRRFGKLVAIDRYKGNYAGCNNGALWLCRCDCGQETVVRAIHLKNGNTRSCGCLRYPKIRAEFLAGQAN